MDTLSSTKIAAIQDLSDGHFLSTLTILYQINTRDPQRAVNVELDGSRETGQH